MTSLANLTEEELTTVKETVRYILTQYARTSGNPCCLVFTADAGWHTPPHACACAWPSWTIEELFQ